MTSEKGGEELAIDWTGITPYERDGYQIYVFVAHVIAGVIASILSFTGDLESWEVGTGVVPPILIALTGLSYLFPTGINWYRDEFLPFINRIQMISEQDSDRFLRFQKIFRFTCLVSGYLATAICQVVWTSLYDFFSPRWVNLSLSAGPLSGLLVGVVVLFIFLWFVLIAFFELILRSVYPSTLWLSKLENQMIAATKKTKDDQE